LSGTVEIERQAAWKRMQHEQRMNELKQQREELRKSNEDARKSNEDARRRHEQRMSELRKQNERLAELESKIDGSFSKHGIYSTPLPKSKQP
jgi:DNA repair exonuclease SbcCD ATPase subunit